MQDLQWMLKLADKTHVTLREDVAETLGVDRHTTVGKIRKLIVLKPKQNKMVKIDKDLNMEL